GRLPGLPGPHPAPGGARPSAPSAGHRPRPHRTVTPGGPWRGGAPGPRGAAAPAPRDPARAHGPRLSRSLAGPGSVNSSPPRAGPGDDMGMSFDLVPAELLAASLTAVLISIPFAFVLAGDRKSTRLNSSHVSISYA